MVNPTRGVAVVFFLIAGHALADYALQSDAMAVCKCRKAGHRLQATVPWYYWLTAHALIHGGTVGFIVKWWGYSNDAAVILGLAETVIHWFIDTGKCEKFYGMAVDQMLHVVCKVAWWALLAQGVLS